MPRLVGPDDCVTEIEAGGVVHKRKPDGTFHVTESMAKYVKHQSGGDMTEVGLSFTESSPGYRCQSCGFLAFFADHCGRCQGTDLVLESHGPSTTIGPLGVPI